MLLFLNPCSICVLWFPPGTQGVIDRHSSPEHCRGTLQSASFPGACSVPFWNWISQRLWRPQNGGTGAKYTLTLALTHSYSYTPIHVVCASALLVLYSHHWWNCFLGGPQVQKLQAILKPMMLRRLKEDVEKNLAPKQETIIEVSVNSTHPM